MQTPIEYLREAAEYAVTFSVRGDLVMLTTIPPGVRCQLFYTDDDGKRKVISKVTGWAEIETAQVNPILIQMRRCFEEATRV